MTSKFPVNPRRGAWVEIHLPALRQNLDVIKAALPSTSGFISVLKDDAYGHGALEVAKIAAEKGAAFLALVTVDEAIELREGGIKSPILLLGERQPEEFEACLHYDLTPSLATIESFTRLNQLAAAQNRQFPVHVKIDTGMSRYGVKWDEAPALLARCNEFPALQFEGIMSHFAMSDELDKTFALTQLDRFKTVLQWAESTHLHFKWRHICNSGGFLDLPQAHFDLVRIGIAGLGVYPSKVCRRLHGLEPIMSVKARVAFLKDLRPGETVGYGMRYKAETQRRIAVIPIGYGDGFPRVRNQGEVLIHGKRAPLVGGVSMDAITVDVTDIPETQMWDEVTLLGKQGGEEITIHDIAALRNSVSYDAMVSWKPRLPRIFII